ncbi:MAG: hypothetical protein IPK39_18155 [Sulfuritalea sp.]|nr:hypothetical protein [Sulfuritalea sp.]
MMTADQLAQQGFADNVQNSARRKWHFREIQVVRGIGNAALIARGYFAGIADMAIRHLREGHKGDMVLRLAHDGPLLGDLLTCLEPPDARPVEGPWEIGKSLRHRPAAGLS